MLPLFFNDYILNMYCFPMQDFIVDLLLMHDMFAPVANVMTTLQSISIPQWKANLYAKKVAKWLVDASNECHTHGNMDFFPTMKKNMEVHYYTMHEGLF